MPRHEVAKDGGDGWSEWIAPSMHEPFRMSCCDCGLVHDILFRVAQETRRVGPRGWEGKFVKGLKVVMKARRNERATGQKRRHRARTP